MLKTQRTGRRSTLKGSEKDLIAESILNRLTDVKRWNENGIFDHMHSDCDDLVNLRIQMVAVCNNHDLSGSLDIDMQLELDAISEFICHEKMQIEADGTFQRIIEGIVQLRARKMIPVRDVLKMPETAIQELPSPRQLQIKVEDAKKPPPRQDYMNREMLEILPHLYAKQGLKGDTFYQIKKFSAQNSYFHNLSIKHLMDRIAIEKLN